MITDHELRQLADGYGLPANKLKLCCFLIDCVYAQPELPKTQNIESKAKTEVRSIRPEIRGGDFVDPDFRELLELLKVNMICTWDLRSSVYYLTMKMLGQPNTPEYKKYSELSSAIFNELSDTAVTFGHWSTDVRLFGSDGTEHTKEKMAMEAKATRRGFGGTTRALDMFIASLNWLAYKSIYYSLAARYLKADTFLHPIRHAYQIHWFRKTGASCQSPRLYPSPTIYPPHQAYPRNKLTIMLQPDEHNMEKPALDQVRQEQAKKYAKARRWLALGNLALAGTLLLLLVFIMVSVRSIRLPDTARLPGRHTPMTLQRFLVRMLSPLMSAATVSCSVTASLKSSSLGTERLPGAG